MITYTMQLFSLFPTPYIKNFFVTILSNWIDFHTVYVLLLIRHSELFTDGIHTFCECLSVFHLVNDCTSLNFILPSSVDRGTVQTYKYFPGEVNFYNGQLVLFITLVMSNPLRTQFSSGLGPSVVSVGPSSPSVGSSFWEVEFPQRTFEVYSSV